MLPIYLSFRSVVTALACIAAVGASTNSSHAAAAPFPKQAASTRAAAGTTPFLASVTVSVPETDLEQVEFTVVPKPGTKSRALHASYSLQYLRCHGQAAANGELTVPVFGLYAGFTNTVELRYTFTTSPARQENVSVATAPFDDPCGWSNPQVVVPRNDTPLDYDFFLMRGFCGTLSPIIMDTDGEVRWVNTDGANTSHAAAFYNNAIYHFVGSQLLKLDLNGSIELVADYSSLGVTSHHNMDPGKTGILLEVDRQGVQVESAIMEAGFDGTILKTWYLDEIIAAAMTAGGDDPALFVRPWPEDWFHMNSAVYWPQDDSIVVSSRENFVICLDYATGAIKWIYGDQTKQWHQFPSLAQNALLSAPGTLPPIGQHSLSITADNQLLLFNNGRASNAHVPMGEDRGYSVASKYQLFQAAHLALETFRYENSEPLDSQYCSSVYKAGSGASYLLDYAFIANSTGDGHFADLQGITASGTKAFEYRYPTNSCDLAYGSTPINLEALSYTGSCPLLLTNAVSRVTHGAAGDFDLPLLEKRDYGAECRNTGGNYNIVFSFNAPVASATAARSAGNGNAGSPIFSGSEVTVPLSGVADLQRIEVTLTNVTTADGQSLESAVVGMNIVIGDSTGNRSVNASDIAQVKAQSGMTVDATNFRSDINANGSITASDVSEIKAHTGNTLSGAVSAKNAETSLLRGSAKDAQ